MAIVFWIFFLYPSASPNTPKFSQNINLDTLLGVFPALFCLALSFGVRSERLLIMFPPGSRPPPPLGGFPPPVPNRLPLRPAPHPYRTNDLISSAIRTTLFWWSTFAFSPRSVGFAFAFFFGCLFLPPGVFDALFFSVPVVFFRKSCVRLFICLLPFGRSLPALGICLFCRSPVLLSLSGSISR